MDAAKTEGPMDAENILRAYGWLLAIMALIFALGAVLETYRPPKAHKNDFFGRSKFWTWLWAICAAIVGLFAADALMNHGKAVSALFS